MLALTRKTDYALVALATLASLRPERLSARALAHKAHLPLPALRNILKRLGCHGLLASEQGPQGGYRLARPADQITVAEVVEVIEGPVRFAPCCAPDGSVRGNERQLGHEHRATWQTSCPLEDSCLIKGAIRSLHGRLHDFLRQTTIRDLVTQGQRTAGSRRELPAHGQSGQEGNEPHEAKVELIGKRG